MMPGKIPWEARGKDEGRKWRGEKEEEGGRVWKRRYKEGEGRRNEG